MEESKLAKFESIQCETKSSSSAVIVAAACIVSIHKKAKAVPQQHIGCARQV